MIGRSRVKPYYPANGMDVRVERFLIELVTIVVKHPPQFFSE